jgi:hypothetical protein
VRGNDNSWTLTTAEATRFTGMEAHHLDHLDRRHKLPFVASAALEGESRQYRTSLQPQIANALEVESSLRADGFDCLVVDIDLAQRHHHSHPNLMHASTTILIDDCVDNIVLARQVGIHAIHFDMTNDPHDHLDFPHDQRCTLFLQRLHQYLVHGEPSTAASFKDRRCPRAAVTPVMKEPTRLRPHEPHSALCTPSPVTKPKGSAACIGRPKSKRCTKFIHRRNNKNTTMWEMQDVHPMRMDDDGDNTLDEEEDTLETVSPHAHLHDVYRTSRACACRYFPLRSSGADADDASRSDVDMDVAIVLS